VPATHFVLGVAIQPLRSCIPGQDDSIQRGRNDRVVRVLNDRSQLEKALFGLLARLALLVERQLRGSERASPLPGRLLYLQ
jgi:hypothetical protein